MKLSLKKFASTIAVTTALVFAGVGLIGAPAYATPAEKVCEGVGHALGENCEPGGTGVDQVWLMAGVVINWILVIAGIVAVGFIIFAGIRYVTSGGDAEKVKSAKNTLLYAIIGLLIAALAMVIVNIVLGVGFNLTA